MAPQQTAHLLSPTELSYLHTSLSLNPPIRPDARSPTSFRPLVAETDLLPSANGSARLCFADGTEAIVGVKAEVERDDAGSVVGHGARRDEEEEKDVTMEGVGDEGRGDETRGDGDDEWIEVSIDMPGCRDDDAVVVFLGKMIHEGLVADGGLRGRLVINGRWHWRLYIDILLLSPPLTYPLPLLSLGTHLALLSTRLPAPISTGDEDPLFNDDWDASIPLYPSLFSVRKGKSSTSSTQKQSQLARPPITLLITAISNNVFFDPTHAELAVADAVLAVTIGFQEDPSTDLQLHAIRTIDPPSRLSLSSSSSSTTPSPANTSSESDAGTWTAKKGGVGRKVVGRMVRMCVERGGVGEEVLRGLEGFVG